MDTALEIQTNTATEETTATVTIPTTVYIKEDGNGVSRWDEETQSWIEVQT